MSEPPPSLEAGQGHTGLEGGNSQGASKDAGKGWVEQSAPWGEQALGSASLVLGLFWGFSILLFPLLPPLFWELWAGVWSWAWVLLLDASPGPHQPRTSVYFF